MNLKALFKEAFASLTRNWLRDRGDFTILGSQSGLERLYAWLPSATRAAARQSQTEAHHKHPHTHASQPRNEVEIELRIAREIANNLLTSKLQLCRSESPFSESNVP